MTPHDPVAAEGLVVLLNATGELLTAFLQLETDDADAGTVALYRDRAHTELCCRVALPGDAVRQIIATIDTMADAAA